LDNFDMFTLCNGDFVCEGITRVRARGKPNLLNSAGIVADITKRDAVRPVFEGL
jgi:hypothetical protein